MPANRIDPDVPRRRRNPRSIGWSGRKPPAWANGKGSLTGASSRDSQPSGSPREGKKEDRLIRPVRRHPVAPLSPLSLSLTSLPSKEARDLPLRLSLLRHHGRRGESSVFAVLRCHGRRCSHHIQRHGCRIRHGQVGRGHSGHVRHEAGADHEVHHPRRHGGYHRHLRPGGRHPHSGQGGRAADLLPLQGLRPPRGRPVRGAVRPGRRLRHRHRGRRRRQGHGPAAPPLRRDDPHPHLCRGTGSVWSDCGHFLIHQDKLNGTNASIKGAPPHQLMGHSSMKGAPLSQPIGPSNERSPLLHISPILVTLV